MPAHNSVEAAKKNTLDSSSSNSYNKHAAVEAGYAGYSRSLSQPATNGYSGPSSGKYSRQYSDYKPLPPPKTSVYKPVPPPKPKPFSRSNSQPPAPNNNMTTESNYMNGNYITTTSNGEQPEYSSTVSHYHSSRVAGIENGYASTNGNSGYGRVNGHGMSNGHQSLPNGHYDHDNDNGVDSGQGSSLDRDYSSYNGQYNGNTRDNRYPAGGQNGGTVWSPASAQQDRQQYYYNLPHRQTQNGDSGEQTNQNYSTNQNAGYQASTNQSSPRRRAPGDTLDLTNREYRGSAFELYKKPGYSIPSTYSQDVPR